MKENQQVIMVLSKKSIHKPYSIPNDYELESNGDLGYRIMNNKEESARGSLMENDAFNDSRLFIQDLHIEKEKDFAALLQALVSRLVLLNESKASKYPNYALLDAKDISCIKVLARMGFTPYLGEWKSTSKEDNEKIWDIITQNLRESN